MNSAINPSDIHVHIGSGPLQRGLFRTGHWKAEYQGQEFTFYSSVSARLSLPDQCKVLERDAALYLAKQAEGRA